MHPRLVLVVAFALLLGSLAHAVGWPVARRGAQSISDALASRVRVLGGDIRIGHRIDALREVPHGVLTLCDIAPEQLARIAADRLPTRFTRQLKRFRRGPGVFKVDWALDGPIPWRASACRHATTIHIGGSFEEIAASERASYEGRVPEQPFVIVAQPSVCDPTRAPDGAHVAWGYCHVPTDSTVEMTGAIERQIEPPQVEPEEHRGDDHDERRRVHFAPRRPGHPAHLVAHLGQEGAAVAPPPRDAAALARRASRTASLRYSYEDVVIG